MKKILASVFMTAVCLSVFAQQKITSDNLASFNRVELIGNMTVEMIQSDSTGTAVDIKLNNTDISRVEWGVKNGLLSIRLKPGGGSGANAEVKLNFANLTSLKISGANVNLKAAELGMLDTDVTAGGTLNLNAKIKDLLLKVSGNSAANITGQCKYYTLDATTRSKVDSRELNTMSAVVKATSGAQVYVAATERLEMNADSGSSIFYKGNPEILRSTSRLMSDINNIGK